MLIFERRGRFAWFGTRDSLPMVHFRYFLIATQFLTRLPIPARFQSVWGMEDLRDSVHMFPLVGVLVGLGASLVYAAAVFCNLPPVIAAILAVATQILMTGALHEDGLADVCDGFGGGRTREEKLAITRDSRLGTYGAIGLILSLGLRTAAIAHLADPEVVTPALIAAAALSRAGSDVGLAEAVRRVVFQAQGATVVQPDLFLEEVRTLTDLIVNLRTAVLRPNLARAGEDLSRRKEAGHVLDDLTERQTAVDQVVLVSPVRVALPITVVLVDDEALAGLEPVLSGLDRGRQDGLACLVVERSCHRVAALRS